jgi:hypothetical protein
MNKFDKRLAFIKTVCVTKKLTGNVKLANERYISMTAPTFAGSGLLSKIIPRWWPDEILLISLFEVRLFTRGPKYLSLVVYDTI